MRKRGRKLTAAMLSLAMLASVCTSGVFASDEIVPGVGESAAEITAEALTELPDGAPAEGDGQETADAGEQTTESGGQEQYTESIEAEPETAVQDQSEDGTEYTAEEQMPESETGAEAGTENAGAEETEPDSAGIALEEQSIAVAVEGGTVTLSGLMPEGAAVTAVPAEVAIEGQNVLAAYDITIYAVDGSVYQPDQDAIRVEIAAEAVQAAVTQEEKILVYHMENESAQPEKVEDVDTISGTVAFDAESFSIYVVATPNTHYTHTYVFYNSDGTTVNTQILSSGEKLVEPETPQGAAHQTFTGWYTEDGERFEFETFGTEGSLDKDLTTSLYAHYETVYYVFYMNESGTAVIYTQSYSTDNATIVTDKVPFVTSNMEKALIGWSTDPNATTPDETLSVNGDDVTLYPVLAAARWIIYDSQGGTAVDPAYVLSGEFTVAPTAPTRTGYNFTRWYTDAECTRPFTFGNTLESNITLYAGWQAAQTTYTVIFWQQQVTDAKDADDDAKTYDYASSEVRTATTGESVTVTSADTQKAGTTEGTVDYTGFTYNENKTESVVVEADGSTILNVYYDRVLITYVFMHREQGGGPGGNQGQKTYYTCSGLYGSTLGANDAVWPSIDRYRWKYKNTDMYMSFLDIFTYGYNDKSSTTITFESEIANSNEKRTIRHYKESTDGSWIPADVVYGYESNFNFTNKYTGFTVTYYGTNANERKLLPGSFYSMSAGSTLYVYHARNSYTLDYINGPVGRVKSETIRYEASLQGYGAYVPDRPRELPEYYTFQGWYADPEGVTPFDFNRTMPANQLAVYAKWAPEDVTVTFDLNGGVAGESWNPQTMAAGSTVTEPADPTREGYVFTGWTRNGEPFNFETQIYEDTVLTAQWISEDAYKITYKPGDGTGTDTVDTLRYTGGSGAEAKILEVPEGWTAPENSGGFLYWIDKDGTVYYPGDSILINSDVELTAIWGNTRTTALTYNANGGSFGSEADPNNSETVTVVIDVPNQVYAIENYTPTREGYQFAGWTLAADGNGNVLSAGDEIEVDTLEPQSNVLYAKWVKVYTVTVQKIVSGSMGDTSSDIKYDFSYSVTADGTTTKGSASIAHNGSFVITGIAEGSELAVTETTTKAVDGYTTSYQIGVGGEKVSGASATATITDDITIIFYNEKDVVVPTGLTDPMRPFAAMLGLALLGAGCFLAVSRRRRYA